MDLLSILESTELEAKDKVALLLDKQISIPVWSDLAKNYYPENHAIVTDHLRRVDKTRKDGSIDKASRIYIGMEKLLVSRITDFMFALPVKRVYHYDKKNKQLEEIVKAIECVYKHARIDSINIQRSKMLYAACEYMTLWYVVERKNSLYGFDSNYKLKCVNFSPMNGVELYPYFDEYGDMIAMTFKSKVKKDDHTIVYVETYTATRHCKWSYGEGGEKGWVEVVNEEIVGIGKIPAIYMMRPEPIYHGLEHIREEIEYKLSENSDTISYNSAPIIKVAGGITGDENKGESQRIIRVANGGDVSYVSWQQSVESLKYQIDALNELFFKLPQMADISAAKMMSLGNIGVDARQTIFTDAHLKVGEESGPWTETFEREFNIVKAFLGMMNDKWKTLLDQIEAEHIITPFIQNDEGTAIKNYMAANGGKPVISHLDSIRYAGLSENAEQTLKEIEEEQKKENANNLPSIFSGE